MNTNNKSEKFQRRRLFRKPIHSSCNWTRPCIAVAIGAMALATLSTQSMSVDALLHQPKVSRKRHLNHNLSSVHSTISPNQQTSRQPPSAKNKKDPRNNIRYKSDPKQKVHNNKKKSNNIPWGADFVTSRKTQAKIQSSAKTVNSNSDSAQAAHDILQTLLDTPSTECNPANIVCALTLSAKSLGGRQTPANRRKISSELHQSLRETIRILQILVDGHKLSPRQLCNSAWAIAKHVEQDQSLSIDEIFDSIALCMISHLEKMRGSNPNSKHVQTGELSMLLWAFACAKPRELPPGWERPPQFEEISPDKENFTKRKPKNKNRQDHLVSFVSEIDITNDNNLQEEDQSHRSATSRLFDAAAIAFCRGEGAAVLQTSDNNNSMLKSCTWSELSNVAWSFATRGAYGTHQSEALMTFLAREATRRLNFARQAPPFLTGGKRNKYCKVLPRDAIQIAWALGTMESDNVSNGNALVYLIDAIHDYWIAGSAFNERYRQLSSFKGADLVQLASALAHGRLDNQSILGALYQECLDRLHKSEQHKNTCFSPSELSILLWAQARLNLNGRYGSVFSEFPSDACRAIFRQMSKRNKVEDHLLSPAIIHQFGLHSQEQANICWSLTVLNQFDEHITRILQNIFNAASSRTDCTIQLEHAHQFWQAFFILSDDCPEAVEFVPLEFSQYLKKRWEIEKGRYKKSSYRHRAISKTLKLLGVAHQNEYKEDVDVAIALRDTHSFTHEAQMSMDALNEGKAQHKIAVEFDGPYHFTVTGSTGKELSEIKNGKKIIPRVLGHTILKYKMLKKKGWTVVRIPWYEWDKIPHWASMERQRYLQRCLKTHQEIQFSEADVSQYQALPKTRHSRFD